MSYNIMLGGEKMAKERKGIRCDVCGESVIPELCRRFSAMVIETKKPRGARIEYSLLSATELMNDPHSVAYVCLQCDKGDEFERFVPFKTTITYSDSW